MWSKHPDLLDRTNCTAVRCHSCLHKSHRLAGRMGGGGGDSFGGVYLDVPGRVEVRINGDGINGL